MPITRLQSKKINAVNAAATEANTKGNTKAKAKATLIHNINFIDASKEWRKNKVKHTNCTFEYIWI